MLESTTGCWPASAKVSSRASSVSAQAAREPSASTRTLAPRARRNELSRLDMCTKVADRALPPLTGLSKYRTAWHVWPLLVRLEPSLRQAGSQFGELS